MKKTAVWGILLTELIILLCGCKTAVPVKSTSVSSLDSVSQSIIQSEPETRTAVLCMTDINHPVYRIVQLGFVDSARQLGYDWHILGKADATPVEQRLEWFRGVKEYEADGALCWVWDDTSYDFLKKVHGMGVKTAVLHFPHTYADTKEFIDVNVYPDLRAGAEIIAEFMVRELHDAGVYSGSIGIAINGSGCCSQEPEEVEVLRTYMAKRYPEYIVLSGAYESWGVEQSRQLMTEYILENPDMVAVLDTTGGSVLSEAKQAAGREDIVVVGYNNYTTLNLELLDNGSIDALLTQPLYKEAWFGMQLIDQLLEGQVFSRDENLWRQSIAAPLIYSGGTGEHDPAYYEEQYVRSQGKFDR